MEPSLGGKWLELLSEIAPGLKRAAIMFNPGTAPVSVYMPAFEAAARSLKVVPIISPVHSDAEIESAIIALGREPGGCLVIMPDVFMEVHRVPIISAAGRALLTQLLDRCQDGLRLSEHVEDTDGAVVFRQACVMGREGIVAKRRD